MLRNREVRRFAILFLLMAAVFVALGFAVHPWAGLLVMAAAAAFGAAFFAFTKARYQGIARLSAQIDRVLHHDDHLSMEDAEEGELSILHSEITKMTLRIREQNGLLKKEKEHLADSLADIAHQLRTPLTSANLILSLMAGQPQQQERRALAREAEALLVRMDWLLTSLLKLSRLDAGVVVFQYEPVEVSQLLQTALRPLLVPLELHQIQVGIDAPKQLTISCDPAWLSEALQNILKNSLESVGENGRIEIVCADNPLYSEITVRDSGAGFAAGEIPRLFDRFYRGNGRDATGYGIGLALCKRIITRQGGTITAANHPRGGALFTIRFPK